MGKIVGNDIEDVYPSLEPLERKQVQQLMMQDIIKYSDVNYSLHQLKVVQLKALLESKGINPSGKKEILIQRVLENFDEKSIMNYIQKRWYQFTPKGEMLYRTYREQTLLDELQNSADVVCRHFALLKLQNFYYSLKEVDLSYVEKCIKYCFIDIDSLDELNRVAGEQEANLVKMCRSYTLNYDPIKIEAEMEERKREGFIGDIRAFSFIYNIIAWFEKNAKYNEAIALCDAAISHNYDLHQKREEIISRMNKHK